MITNESEILHLEQQLLLEPVRSSPDKLAELLMDEFVEHCSTGNIWRYARGDTCGWGEQRNWEIVDFQAQQLAEGLILATYRLLKHGDTDPNMRVSLRSSIWKLTGGKWKMLFHQGTPSR